MYRLRKKNKFFLIHLPGRAKEFNISQTTDVKN